MIATLTQPVYNVNDEADVGYQLKVYFTASRKIDVVQDVVEQHVLETAGRDRKEDISRVLHHHHRAICSMD